MAGRVFLHELHDNENLAQIKTNSQLKTRRAWQNTKARKRTEQTGRRRGGA
jgi:hypothetical protein